MVTEIHHIYCCLDNCFLFLILFHHCLNFAFKSQLQKQNHSVLCSCRLNLPYQKSSAFAHTYTFSHPDSACQKLTAEALHKPKTSKISGTFLALPFLCTKHTLRVGFRMCAERQGAVLINTSADAKRSAQTVQFKPATVIQVCCKL